MNKYTNKQIKSHLDNIKSSIENDVGKVLSVYSANMCGFFAIPRLLFPEIDGMGSFLTGDPENTTKNIITYFKEVLSEIDTRYANYAVFITYVYRHGLLHQHHPKMFEYKKKGIGWMFNISNTNNPIEIQRPHHLNFVGNILQIDMNLFYKDVIDSIDKLYEKIINSYKDSFAKSIQKQSRPLNKTSILKKKKNFIKKSDFNFFKDFK
jgi:hypothetical protein